MLSLQGFACLLLVVVSNYNIQARSMSPQEDQLYSNQIKDSREFLDATDYVIARDVFTRDPEFMLEILSKMKSGVARPMENKRGIDFGLGRGFSGSQAAKHFLGMAAASFAGGPGKRKRMDPSMYPIY